jgi:hypothetical protein
MPPCKNDSLKNYKGDEPSPKGLGYCAHAEKVGTTKKGLDGNKWIISQTSSGTRRWTKLKDTSKRSTTKSVAKSAKKTVAKSPKKSVAKSPKKTVASLRPKNNCKRFAIYEKKGFFFGKDELIGLEGDVKGTIHKYISFNNFDPNPTEIPSGFIKVNSDNYAKYYCDNDPLKIYPTDDEFKKINKSGKQYLILDNGGYTHLVHIYKNIVSVYECSYNEKIKYIKFIKKYNTLKIYIGKSVKCDMTNISGGYGPEYDGNSILLKISKNTYVSIGWDVYEFSVDDDIVEYHSPVGNSGVPYPVAIGKKNIYFVVEKKYISIDKFKKLTDMPNINDIKLDLYSYFYGDKTLFPKGVEKSSTKLKIKMISKRNI